MLFTFVLRVGGLEADGRECSGPKKQLIAAQSRLREVLCLKRRADALLGERRGVDRVMDEPRPVVVPEMVIRVYRIKPNSGSRLMIHDGLLIEQTPSREI
jgi:hypothetical protein